jgi:hypothetical protein
LKEIEPEALAKATTTNFFRLFGKANPPNGKDPPNGSVRS